MNLGKINVITPPDKLFNLTQSFLLIKPSQYVKQQFQTLLSHSIDDVNVFIFDDQETDIEWLLSVSMQADHVIIDVDNCDTMTKQFITFILAQPNAQYLTTDEITPYHLISRNRIYDLDWIKELTEDDDEQE
jgi:hypothetical protein